MLYAISAPSGAGKTTIVRQILEKNPAIAFSISATTRKEKRKRKGRKRLLLF
jgi:guanylate kinase